MHDVLAGHVERGAPPGLVAASSAAARSTSTPSAPRTVGGSRPDARDTIFRIASMTKPVTAVATLILVEECPLRLDDPVDGLLPELADRRVLKRLDGPLDDTVPAQRPITVRDLLTFRLGFGIVMAPPGTYPIQAEPMADWLGPGRRPGVDARARRVDPAPRRPAADAPARRAVDVPHRLRRARRAHRARRRAAVRDVPAGAHLRAAGHERHRLQRARRPSIDRLATGYWTDPDTGDLSSDDEPPAASGPRRRHSRPAAAAWCPPSTTTSRSARCC